jgi:hypothetical protein
MAASLMKDAWTNYTIKWECLNTDFDQEVPEGEDAETVFMDGQEAELEVASEPGQTHSGIGPGFIVGEGKYVVRLAAEREDDDTQVHRYAVKLEVTCDVE